VVWCGLDQIGRVQVGWEWRGRQRCVRRKLPQTCRLGTHSNGNQYTEGESGGQQQEKEKPTTGRVKQIGDQMPQPLRL
jgi:hypothetical protein